MYKPWKLFFKKELNIEKEFKHSFIYVPFLQIREINNTFKCWVFFCKIRELLHSAN